MSPKYDNIITHLFRVSNVAKSSSEECGNMEYVPLFLPALEAVDREMLLKQLRTGKISKLDFADRVTGLGLEKMATNMRVIVPDLPAFSLNENFDPSDFFARYYEGISAKNSRYQTLLRSLHEDVPVLVQCIFDDLQELRIISDTYAEVLGRRWTKKHHEKRKTLLLEAWPNMSHAHRPDFEVIRHKLKGFKHRDALMMPYINIEDLSQGENLLNLIESRTKETPEYFAWFDSIHFVTANTMEAVAPVLPLRLVMLLTGQKTRDTYGNLIHLQHQDDVQDILWTGFGFQAGLGLIVLENQKKLYHFLLRCTRLLLHDIDLSIPLSTEITTGQRQTILFKDISVPLKRGVWQSVTEMNIQALYRLPQPVSVESLRILANAKREEAEDMFWAVHEDPALFQEQLQMYREQYVEPARQAYGRSSNVDDVVIKNACIGLICDTCSEVIMWDWITLELIELENIKSSLEMEIKLDKRLPLKYEMALERFMALTCFVWRKAVAALHRVLMSSPDFRGFYTTIPEQEYATFLLDEKTKDSWPTILILADGLDLRTAKMLGYVNILDEMEHLIISDPTQRAMINTCIAREISRIAALAQIRDAIVQHQPTIQVTQDYTDLYFECKAQAKVLKDLQQIFATIPLVAYTKPRSAFRYPAEKKRTSQHVEQMRLAEAKLDAFWEQADHGFVNCTGKTLQQWMGKSLPAREVRRTKEWQPDEDQRPRTVIGLSSSDTIHFRADYIPEAIEKLSIEPQKKQKTRGEPGSGRASDTNEAASISPGADISTQTFSLPNRALKTMLIFYPNTIEDKTGRKIVWKDFLQAMYYLGFEIQKRHGSEWYFEPSWKRNAPITIHEPHPSHEMRPDRIRFEAHRMARKYGWDSDTFQAS